MSSDDGFEMLSTMDCIYSRMYEETMRQTWSPRMCLTIREATVRFFLFAFFHCLHSIRAINKSYLVACNRMRSVYRKLQTKPQLKNLLLVDFANFRDAPISCPNVPMLCHRSTDIIYRKRMILHRLRVYFVGTLATPPHDPTLY